MSKAKIKTLCLCAGGVVRSVTLAALLKYEWKHDAVAASLETNSKDTLRMLYDWADHIYIVEPDMWCEIPEDVKHKTRCLDIGQDRWGKSMDPELIEIAWKLLVADLGWSRKLTLDQILEKRHKYVKRQEQHTEQHVVSTHVDTGPTIGEICDYP